MIHNFSGTVVAKKQKTKKDGSPSKIFELTIQTKDEELILDGFGDNIVVGTTYESITMEIKQTEWNGRRYSNLFVKTLANPSYVPDPDPSENTAMSGVFSNPTPVENIDPYRIDTIDPNDDLPF